MATVQFRPSTTLFFGTKEYVYQLISIVLPRVLVKYCFNGQMNGQTFTRISTRLETLIFYIYKYIHI